MVKNRLQRVHMNFVYMRVISLLLRMFEKKPRGVVQCDAISIISQ